MLRRFIYLALLGAALAGGNATASDGNSDLVHDTPARGYTLLQGSYSNPVEYQTLVDALQTTDTRCTVDIEADAGELFVLVGC